MSSQTNNSETLWFKRQAFYNGLKSKVGLTAAKAAALRVNLNVQGCVIVVLQYEPLHPDPSLATPEVQIYTSSRHTGKCMLASAVHGRLTLLY